MLISDGKRETTDSLKFDVASDIVELVVFTTDTVFMQTLREAVGGSRRLWHVPSADKVSDLLLAGQVGILVLDVQSHSDAAGTFVAQIKHQFPDLVVIVAGSREAETSLARLISDGTVYRFIHKPMSPGRAKLFADSAVKKFEEQRRYTRLPPPAARVPAGNRRRTLVVAALAVVGVGLAAALIVARLRRHGESFAESPPETMADARAPAPDSASGAGTEDARDRLLALAESALLEERLNDAAAAIDAARSGGVEGGRIAFLTSQLAKMREQQKRGAAARAKLDSRPAEAGSPDERLQRLLGLAAQRIKEGRLIDPDADSAKSYVQEAMRIDPSGNATQAAKETLAKVLMADTHAAVERGDYARAAALLDAAEGIAAPSNVENARQQLNAARQQGEAAATDQLLKTVQERIQQDRLIEPANDSAKYYLLKLRDADSGHAGLAAALEDLGGRMVAKARRAIDQKQYDVARDWLNEAAGIGFSNSDSQSASAELGAQRPLANVVDASTLSAVKTVTPEYPARAMLNRTEGWVELEFTVSENGEVKDITVSAANPPGVFDHAAIGALARWRYRPVIVDDKPVPQRARIRLRFTLAG